MITITRHQYASVETHYTAVRNGTTYYVSDGGQNFVYIAQRYTKRNGTTGQRRLPFGKLYDELLAALAEHKAAPLRERLCTPVGVYTAARLLAAA